MGSKKHGKLLDIGGTHHHQKVLFRDGPKASMVRFWQIDAWHPCCSANSKATVSFKGVSNKIRTELNYADLIGTPYTNTTVPKLGGMFLSNRGPQRPRHSIKIPDSNSLIPFAFSPRAPCEINQTITVIIPGGYTWFVR